MGKRFVISWIVVFVLWMLGSFVVHGLLLHADYAALPNLFRPEADAQKYFPLMILAHVIMAGAPSSGSTGAVSSRNRGFRKACGTA
jgi:hypothetical protein